jgi:RNA polymerase sigma factor (sigma-70 family)
LAEDQHVQIGAVTSPIVPAVEEWWNHWLPDWPRIWGACRRRTRSWPIPPRWRPSEWHEELDAEGIAAACKAIQKYDPSRGTSINSFVYHQMVSGALSRYRQEWSYATRCSNSPVSQDSIPQPDHVAGLDEEREDLLRSLSRLVDDDRQLLERIYWDGYTEAEIAGLLGISQQAVSKRKQRILLGLRRRFRIGLNR